MCIFVIDAMQYRGTNLRAMFEGGAAAGGSSEQVHIDNSQSGGTGTGEDESLAAARARRGVSNKAMFEVSESAERRVEENRGTNKETKQFSGLLIGPLRKHKLTSSAVFFMLSLMLS